MISSAPPVADSAPVNIVEDPDDPASNDENREKIVLPKPKKLSSLQIADVNLVAECHIMLEKLMATFDEFNADKDNVLLSFNNTETPKFEEEVSNAMKKIIVASSFSQEIKFEEKVWLCGQKVGKITGYFKIENLPFLSQMKLGLLKLRNNGITMSSKQAMIESLDMHAKN